MNNSHYQPLELLLIEKARDQSQQPFLTSRIVQQYDACLSYLRASVYPSIDAGLASLSEENGIYTLHGPDHFDEVVKYAGLLLGVNKKTIDLNAYELFVLLVAIRIHDAGNMFGREKHERRTHEMLSRMGQGIFPDSFEIREVAAIADAHGGKTASGSKDKIKELKPVANYGHVTFRPRLIAAIVRFADEVCENRTRAAVELLSTNRLPQQNEVFHKYASTIKSVVPAPEQHRISIGFEFFVDDALRKWGKGLVNGEIQTVYLLDEIFSRLEKMFQEREYCQRFMREVCNIEQVNATIDVFKTPTANAWLSHESLVKHYDARSEPDDYPSAGIPLSRQLHVDGEQLVQELQSEHLVSDHAADV